MQRCPTCGEDVAPALAVCPKDGTRLSSSDATPQDTLIGQMLGEYRVDECIGYGGMGIVYAGVQPVIGKKVAIKVLRPGDTQSSEDMERLLAEARTVNTIRHRGIIDIFSFGQVPDGRHYFVMEYLDGAPLDTVIAQRAPLGGSEAVSILEDLLDALGAIHAAGVVHRDLKPSNIFVVSQGGGSSYVKVLDFGLAKQSTRTDGIAPATHVVGTPEFMSPEQVRAEAVTPRSDLYSVGVIAFEMLTGRLPFEGQTKLDRMRAHLNEPPPAPSSVESRVPTDLDALVLSLLAKDPAQRPASAKAARKELQRIGKALRMQETSPLAAVVLPVEAVPAERPRTSARVSRPPPSDGDSVKETIVVPPLEAKRELPWKPLSLAVAALALGLWLFVRPTPSLSVPELRAESLTPPIPPLVEPPTPAREVTAPTEEHEPPPAPPAPGALKLEVRGWADVWINGKPRGKVPPQHLFALPSGAHDVDFIRSGKRLARRRIDVKPGEVVKLQIDLTKPVEGTTTGGKRPARNVAGL
jgi:serine/threonine-protein kinase